MVLTVCSWGQAAMLLWLLLDAVVTHTGNIAVTTFSEPLIYLYYATIPTF